MQRIDLIIPAYNEEKRISQTVRNYLAFFGAGSGVRLVVVANGCWDQTAAVVQEMQHAYGDRLYLIEIPESVGKGGAIVRGWQESHADVVGFVDADEATTPQEFQKLIGVLRDDVHTDGARVDGAIASRFAPGSRIVNRTSSLRATASRLFILLVRLLFRLPFHDIQCGAKLFRRTAIAEMLSSITSFNMIFDVELLYKAQQRELHIVEVPTVWIERPGSAMMGSTGKFLRTAWNMLFSLIRLRIF